MKSFFGYPGGKSRLAKRLIAMFPPKIEHYIEPFTGGFSVGLSLLASENSLKEVWLNDADPDVYALWHAAIWKTDEFCDAINSVRPTVQMFYDLRQTILGNYRRSGLQRALDKLLVHKLSYSNMGEMAASPVGGKNQTGNWKFDVRWNPKSICQSVRRVAKIFQTVDVTLTNLNVFDLLKGLPTKWFAYLDPPYVVAGSKCYKTTFTLDEHQCLAASLKRTQCNWLLSYDDTPIVRELYRGQFSLLPTNYQMSSAYRKGHQLKTSTELVIRSAF